MVKKRKLKLKSQKNIYLFVHVGCTKIISYLRTLQDLFFFFLIKEKVVIEMCCKLQMHVGHEEIIRQNCNIQTKIPKFCNMTPFSMRSSIKVLNYTEIFKS